jgi:hypothetical protein
MADIASALKAAQEWVGTVPGVVMVGQGRAEDGSPTVDVWVSGPVAPQSRRPITGAAALPDSLQGFAVRIREAGPIEAH